MKLGELSGHRDAALGKKGGQFDHDRTHALGRLEKDNRAYLAAPTGVAQRSLAGFAWQEPFHDEPLRGQSTHAERRNDCRGSRSGRDAKSGTRDCRDHPTSRVRDTGSAGITYQEDELPRRDARDHPSAFGHLVVLVQRPEPSARGNGVCAEQRPRVASVLAVDDISPTKKIQGPAGEVPEIADRRRDEH